MVRFRLYFDRDKETKWLNRMAGEGWALTGCFFNAYRFTRCEPGEYIYQVDIGDGMFSVSEDYRQFMAEMGVELVCLWGLWVFLRKRAAEGSFEMYTDVDSVYEHYRGIKRLFQIIAAICGICLLIQIPGAIVAGKAENWVAACVSLLVFLVFMNQLRCLSRIMAELKGRLEASPGAAPSASVKKRRAGGASIIMGLFAGLILSVFLHELGHCIAVWLCGGSVTGFHLFAVRPYMTHKWIEGRLPIAVVHASGAGLPLVAAAAVLLFYKRSEKLPFLNITMAVMSGWSILSLIGWIEEPLLYLGKLADTDGDIYKFIHATGLHPAVTALCAGVILALMVFLFVKRMPRAFGKAVGGKFVAMIMIVMSISRIPFMLMGANRICSEGNFQYTVDGSQPFMPQEVFSIDLGQAGEYICYVDLDIDRDGVIAALALSDGNKTYFSTTGAIGLHSQSLPLHLESGSYTLSCYLLDCEEDLLEYRMLVGLGKGDVEAFPWQQDAPATVIGSYRLVQKR